MTRFEIDICSREEKGRLERRTRTGQVSVAILVTLAATPRQGPGGLTILRCPTIREAAMPHLAACPRYEWITSCRSNMPMNCSIFFARVSARFTVWIRNRMAYRFALLRVAKNAFAFGCVSSAR
jgi:hypothetical protein